MNSSIYQAPIMPAASIAVPASIHVHLLKIFVGKHNRLLRWNLMVPSTAHLTAVQPT